MDQSIPELMYTMMSLLFLLLGVVLIASIVMSNINPYDQVTFANVEKLRATMNKACVTGNEQTIKFSMPQNTPSFTGVLPVLPTWITRTNGDPNYVLYYESFPPGEAVGWEVYQDMQNRIIAYLPPGWDDKNYENVVDYFQEIQNEARERNAGLIEGIVIGNIEVGEYRSDFFLGDDPASANRQGGSSGGAGASGSWESSNRDALGRYGEWRYKTKDGIPLDGDNYFKFNNYVSLNNFEKSAIKYLPCGDDALCMKTRSGVHRFELDQCNNIKNVQMVYDARDRTKIVVGGGVVAGGAVACVVTGACAAIAGSVGTVGGVISSAFGWITRAISIIPGSSFITFAGRLTTVAGTTVSVGAASKYAVEWVGGAFLSFKTQDFNIASPCEIEEMTITKAACVNDVEIPSAFDVKTCENGHVARVPMYRYGNDGKLHNIGEHYVCTEKVNSELDELAAEPYATDDQCLQVRVIEKSNGFCWTPDPYKSTMWGWTESIASYMEIIPVHDSLSFLKTDSANAYSFVLSNLNSSSRVRNSLDSPLRWQWPG